MNSESLVPRISVVVPSFNQARYLEQTILSVLNQDYPDVELIVLDGGSTDDSVDIIRRYAASIAFWRSHADRGQAAAIAEGLARSTGDVMCYLNSDDILLPGVLVQVATAMQRVGDRPSWLIGGHVRIDSNGTVWRRDLPMSVSQLSMLLWGSGFAQSSAFWNRRMLDCVGEIDPRLQFCFDYELFLRFAGVCAPLRLDAYLSAFREHSESKSATLGDVHHRELEEVRARYGSVLPKKHAACSGLHWIGYWFQWKALRLRTLFSPAPAVPEGWLRGR